MFSELGDLLEPTAAELTPVYRAYSGSIGLVLIRIVLFPQRLQLICITPSQSSFSIKPQVKQRVSGSGAFLKTCCCCKYPVSRNALFLETLLY
jgi:hypothetical protein